ncbi:MAG: hypothetical protein ABR501_03270 [Pyrinomonadaceae bacterium]
MNYGKLIPEIVGMYEKHGWQLRRILLRPETRASFGAAVAFAKTTNVEDAAVDALWFSRASSGGRDAWELRLLSENPFALFETFEENETEEEREEMRREMEARLKDYIARSDDAPSE